jgi:regulator of replication initiation timing
MSLEGNINMNTSNIFNSTFSTSNPFNLSGQQNNSTQDLENSLLQSYARLEALKQRQNEMQTAQLPKHNVFTDIASEFDGLSADETNFIINSEDYQRLTTRYQNEFSQFLISKFSAEYIQTDNAKTLEEMLFTIRQKKEHYKQKFAEDINEIRDQNKDLVARNNQLAQNNQNLQEQLKQIQERLFKEKL